MAAHPTLFALRLSTAKESLRHLTRLSNPSSRLQHALRRVPSRGTQASAFFFTNHPATSVRPPPLDLAQLSPATLTEVLRRKKDIIEEDLLNRPVQKQAVFTNSELSLKHIDVYGFDFDYTLIQYTPQVHNLIYSMAQRWLVEKLNYPKGIGRMLYDPNFAIRGLHCDITKGLLMKIDAYNHVHPSSVYRGHKPVSKKEVLKLYGGTHIPMHIMERSPSFQNWKMVQFLDLFSIPEATLFADVMEAGRGFKGHINITRGGEPGDEAVSAQSPELQYISRSEIPSPKYLFEDVQNVVRDIHTRGLIHDVIIEDIGKYTTTTPSLPKFLDQLRAAGKKLFLITNSPYWFVNAGMTHAVGSPHWRDLFDIVVVEAMKPSFYSDSERPFRMLNPASFHPSWKPVSSLERGQIYTQGNVGDFIKMTGWGGGRVLYFGDHVFSDLADPIMQLGWKTGAIIPELQTEMSKANSLEAKQCLAKMLALESVLKDYQGQSDPHLLSMMEDLRQKRTEARLFLKEMYNPRFGSVFRTEKSPTYFSLRLSTFANLYMASLDNLMNYSLDYTFIPRRTALPHELDLNFDLDFRLDQEW